MGTMLIFIHPNSMSTWRSDRLEMTCRRQDTSVDCQVGGYTGLSPQRLLIWKLFVMFLDKHLQ